jgi:DMSO reductase anchor subunit
MASAPIARPVELVPPRRQVLWRWPAVVNFVLGGLGGGLYVAAVVAAGFRPSFLVTVASWTGPVLVLAGFAAIATEAGRPLRGPRVLARARTSWMSRELWLGAAFVALVAADLLAPSALGRILAAGAAVGLGLAQGYILRGARGVTAWDVPFMPVVFLGSALVSGTGLYVLIAVATGHPPRLHVLIVTLVLLAAGLFVWGRYLSWSPDSAFERAVAPLTERRAALIIARGGYLVPFALVALAAGLPQVSPPALGLAGGLMVAAQAYAKARLILAAGQFRPITLAVRTHRRSA